MNGEVVTAVLFAVDDDYLRALSPKMTVAEFSARVASAFFLWPKELLESELNQQWAGVTRRRTARGREIQSACYRCA